MRALALTIALAACESTAPCPEPATANEHMLSLVVVGESDEFCFSLSTDLNLTSPASLAAAFQSGCAVSSSLTQDTCPRYLDVDCSNGAALTCVFTDAALPDGSLVGTCQNDLQVLTCDYDALLVPEVPR